MSTDAAATQQLFNHALIAAQANNQLRLYYQPVADMTSGHPIALQALIRLSYPPPALWPTEQPVPIGMELESFAALSDWMFRQACADFNLLQHDGIAPAFLSMNMPFENLHPDDCNAQIERTLADAPIALNRLCFEIKEVAVTPNLCTLYQKFSAAGVGLTLDDFGSGSMSFEILKRLPFNRIKLARSLVHSALGSAASAAIIQSVISNAHQHQIRVIANGIRNKPEYEFFQRCQCDEMQGPYFSEPLPIERIKTLLLQDDGVGTSLQQPAASARTLLLVDDEVNIVSSIKRLLRQKRYTILTANSGEEGLLRLAEQPVDVIVSDQRMPGMTGVEFLRVVKERYPDTIRIVLSGYTDLQSVTDAVNEGAIYKFLTKPWDDVQLTGHIEEAFQRKGMADENRRLVNEVRVANSELAMLNRQLVEAVEINSQQLKLNQATLRVTQEILQHIPTPVIGLDNEAVVVFSNSAADSMFHEYGVLLGSDASQLMPELLEAARAASLHGQQLTHWNDKPVSIIAHDMGQLSQSQGIIMSITEQSRTA